MEDVVVGGRECSANPMAGQRSKDEDKDNDDEAEEEEEDEEEAGSRQQTADKDNENENDGTRQSSGRCATTKGEDERCKSAEQSMWTRETGRVTEQRNKKGTTQVEGAGLARWRKKAKKSLR